MDTKRFKKQKNNNTPKLKHRKQPQQILTPKNKKIKKRTTKKHQNTTTPSLHRKTDKKRKTRINYKNIIITILILLIIIILITSISTKISEMKLPENAEKITPTEFNFTPYGYEWNKELYGKCTALDENNTTQTYYLTLNQMTALAVRTDNTYNLTEGIYINYTYDEKNNVKIIDAIFDKNKNEILKPVSVDEYQFSENARFTARNSEFTTDDFGFTPQEYADSIFEK